MPCESPRTIDAELVRSLLCDRDTRWWMCCTRPRFENRLEAELDKEGAIPVLIRTTVKVRERSGDGRPFDRTERRPLFPGYVFFHGSDKHRFVACDSLATIEVIRIADQWRIANDLANVLFAAENFTDLRISTIKPGVKVEVVNGPLRGMKGYVLDAAPRRFHVCIDMLGQAVSVEIDDPAMIEAV